MVHLHELQVHGSHEEVYMDHGWLVARQLQRDISIMSIVPIVHIAMNKPHGPLERDQNA